MKKIYFLLVAIVVCFNSCTVTESIVVNEDNSGEFYMKYDMARVMTEMGDMFDEGNKSADAEGEKENKVMDTMMVFSEIMETYKDSVAALSEDQRLVLESLKDMYMKMHMDEEKGIMEFGIGMNFNSINDLQDIQDKIKKAQSLNAQSGQAEAMKENSPLGNFMGNDNNSMSYTLSENGFTRSTKVVLPEGADMTEMEKLFDEDDENNQQFIEFFKDAFYNVELTFPKKIKSTSIEGATISEDGKTLSYKSNWIDYLKDPKSLDVNVEFIDE